MKGSKEKLLYWLPLLIIAIGIAILSPIAHLINSEHDNNIHQRTKLNARTYSQQMLMKLEKAADITFAMEQIIVSEKGNFDNFEVVANNLITEDIQCVQLAPDGVVDRIYPSAGNDAGKIDLFNDPERGEISRYARDHKETVIQGPFSLKQGGLGIAVRNPVFISDESVAQKSESFWGFTIAIIKVPQIFEDTITSLSGFGYDYILTVRSEITKGDDELVISTKSQLNSPETYSFVFGYNKWTLKVTPKKRLEPWQQYADRRHHGQYTYNTYFAYRTACFNTSTKKPQIQNSCYVRSAYRPFEPGGRNQSCRRVFEKTSRKTMRRRSTRYR